jgi:hypothetical protein
LFLDVVDFVPQGFFGLVVLFNHLSQLVILLIHILHIALHSLQQRSVGVHFRE